MEVPHNYYEELIVQCNQACGFLRIKKVNNQLKEKKCLQFAGLIKF